MKSYDHQNDEWGLSWDFEVTGVPMVSLTLTYTEGNEYEIMYEFCHQITLVGNLNLNYDAFLTLKHMTRSREIRNYVWLKEKEKNKLC